MAILNNNPLIGSGGQQGYSINNSLRFRSSASAYLSKTFSSSGTIDTWSFWVKRGTLGTAQNIFGTSNGTNQSYGIEFTSSNTLQVFDYLNSYRLQLDTTQVFRDPSAWYHIVVGLDTTQATSSNRCKVYVNGTQVTAFGTATYPTQNTSLNIGSSASVAIGVVGNVGGQAFDGYLADFNFIDGQALTPSSFGETDTTTGVWKPKAYTGTYGTNGFYLKFSDIATTSGSNAGLGKDFSGNSNYWTTNNISVTSGTTYDAMTDVPTNTSATVANYAVLNPLVGSVGVTLSQANLSATFDSASGTRYGTIGTIGVSSGKWYWEYEFSAGGNSALLGITQKPFAVQMGTWPGEQTGDYGYFGSNGNKYTAGSGSAYGATFTTGDIIGVALDLDAGTLTFYKNNSSQGTAFSSISGTFFPAIGKGITATGITSFVNFGQRPFAYTPPTGFVALNTFNLPDSTIKKGNSYMDASLWTGDSTSPRAVVSTLNFKPDFVWTKVRSNTYSNTLYDSVRGGGQALFSDTTGAEQANYVNGYIQSFNSNGWTMQNGSSGGIVLNNSGQTYVAWQWQAGQGTTSSNTSGSITSTVSVNTTAGFSIVSYTEPASGSYTVGHGLGVAPKMIILRERPVVTNWLVWHNYWTPPTTRGLYLNSTSAAFTTGSNWLNSVTSSVFGITVGQVTGGGYTTIAYCFAEIAGFSRFTSYTGNGSADGPFIFCNFRPKFIMLKRTDTTSNWTVYDATRNTYNAGTFVLYPNLSNAEDASTDHFDWLSNGFKMKSTNQNASGGTYIVMAFASNPFKNSNAV